jgi:hypothetical protein
MQSGLRVWSLLEGYRGGVVIFDFFKLIFLPAEKYYIKK